MKSRSINQSYIYIYIKCYWNPRKIHSTPISMGFLQFQSYIHPIYLRIFPNFTWRGDRGRVGAMDLPELSARATSCEGHAPPLRTRSGLARWKSGKLPPKKHEFQGNCQEKQMSFLCFFLVFFFGWVLSNWKRETMGSAWALSKKHTMSFGVNDTCRFSMKILEKWWRKQFQGCGHKTSPDDSCNHGFPVGVLNSVPGTLIWSSFTSEVEPSDSQVLHHFGTPKDRI